MLTAELLSSVTKIFFRPGNDNTAVVCSTLALNLIRCWSDMELGLETQK